MARLIIQHDDHSSEYELGEGAVVIGRDPECELFFADRKLSRRHARFEPDGSGFRLVDLDSRNGTWVNEERVSRRRLSHEDAVRLGSLTIRFEQKESEASAEEEATIYLEGSEETPPPPPGDTDAGADSDASSTIVLGDSAKAPPPSFDAGDDTSTRAPFISASERTPSLEGADPEDTSTRMLSTAADDSATRMVSHAVDDDAVDDTATRMVSSAPDSTPGSGSVPDDSSTRVIPAEERPPALSEAEESQTRIAPGQRPPLDGPAAESAERTVMARDDTGARRRDARTVIFHGEEPGATLAASAKVPDASLSSQANWDATPLAPSVPFAAAAPATAERSWTVSYALITVTLSLFALAVLVLPLASTSTRALDEEVREKGRLMMELLAAVNENALGEGRRDATTVVVVESAPGVTGAYVLDTASRIVAPASRAGESFSIEGLDVPAGSIRSIRSGRTPTGELVVAGPVTYRGRRVGVALVTYRHPGTGAAAVLAIGCVLLGMGLAAAILYGRRMTLLPLQELREDVDILVRGEGDSLVEERPYREVADLARAVNRLASRPPSRPSL